MSAAKASVSKAKLTAEQRAEKAIKKARIQKDQKDASAAAHANREPRLLRKESERAVSLMNTPLCISAFVEYLNTVQLTINGKLWKHPESFKEPKLVVENLIQLMQRRGFNGLTIHGVIDLCLVMQNSELDRETICKHITLFTQSKPNLTIHNVECKFNPEYLRNASTESGPPLSAMTAASTIDYTPKAAHNITGAMKRVIGTPAIDAFLATFKLKRLDGKKTELDWNDVWITAKLPNNASIKGITNAFVPKGLPDIDFSTNIAKRKNVEATAIAIHSSYQYPISEHLSYYKLSLEEIAFINELNSMQQKPDMVQGIKIVCGICWLCGTPIHVFVVKDAKNEWYILNKCGEDEHTIVPGIGNLIGTLAYNAPITISNILAGNTVMQMGLQPSHAWCNKVKSDIGFLLPPYPPGRNGHVSGVNDAYRLEIGDNVVGLIRYMNDVALTLCKGTLEFKQRIDSYELQFKINGNQQISNEFAEQVGRNVRIYINALCMRLNDTNSPTPVPIRWQQALLRTIFNTCLYAYQIKLISAIQWTSTSSGGYQTKYKQMGGENKLFDEFCNNTQSQLNELDLDDSGSPNLQNNINYLTESISTPIVLEALNIAELTCPPVEMLASILNPVELKNVKPASNNSYNANIDLASNENNENNENNSNATPTGLFKGMKTPKSKNRKRTLRKGINGNEAREGRLLATLKNRRKKREAILERRRPPKGQESQMGQGGGHTYKKRRILCTYHRKPHHRRKTQKTHKMYKI